MLGNISLLQSLIPLQQTLPEIVGRWSAPWLQQERSSAQLSCHANPDLLRC